MDEPLSPACMMCERVTGKTTCFPGPCVFHHERGINGTKAHAVAFLMDLRRAMKAPPVYPRPAVAADFGLPEKPQ